MKSDIRTDIETNYTSEFIQNYSLFKKGKLCLMKDDNLTYVHGGKVFEFDGGSVTPEEKLNQIQVFFGYLPDEYRRFNVAKYVNGILNILLDGKDWNVTSASTATLGGSETYRYRDQKFYRVVKGYVFTSWLSEEEMTKKEMVIRILKEMCSKEPFLPPPPPSEEEGEVVEVITPPPKEEGGEKDEEEGEEQIEGENILETSTIVLNESDFPPLPPPAFFATSSEGEGGGSGIRKRK